MKVGVVAPSEEDSIQSSPSVFRSNLFRHLLDCGVHLTHINGTTSPLSEIDLLWDPHVTTGRMPAPVLRQTNTPTVATVHGPGPYGLPTRKQMEWISNSPRELIRLGKNWIRWYYSWQEYCDCIATVSAYAKRSIKRTYLIPPKNIKTIYHGVDHKIFKKEGQKIQNKEYFLHVSSLSSAKNLNRIILSYKKIEKPKPIFLIISGNNIERELPEGVHKIGPVEHSSLPKYYRSAVALVLPSVKETFGLPIVEAMSCGCAVVTSTRTACPEVAGDSALLVDPDSVEDIRGAMKLVSSSQEVRNELRSRGLERAEQFSWKSSARKYALLFRCLTK